MDIKEKQPERCEVVAVYKSGRVEKFFDKLAKGGGIKKPMQKKIDDLKRFPCIVSVEVKKI